MRPLVSLILPLGSGSPHTIASVQAQTFEDWELMLVAPPETDLRGIARLADPRLHLLICDRPGAAAAWNTAAELARGRYVILLEPGDTLTPAAVQSLLTAAQRSEHGAAFGEYRFTAPIGEMPADPLAGAGRELGLADLLRASYLIPPAQLIRRDLLAAHRFREDLPAAADLDVFLRLALAGVRWRRAAGRLASRPLAPLADDPRCLLHLWTCLDLVDRVAKARPDLDAPLREQLYRGYLQLAAFNRCPKDPRQMALLISFGSIYTRWWQRHGFRGPAPLHLLPAADFSSHEHGELLAERLLESCDPAAPIVLLGLGRNGRRLAARLHALGRPVVGRDDGLTGPPAWARHDGIPVTVLPPSAPYDPKATHLMTLLNDDQYLARLPGGLRVLRWRDMPDLLDREWREAIRAHDPARGPWMPPAPRRGAYAHPAHAEAA